MLKVLSIRFKYKSGLIRNILNISYLHDFCWKIFIAIFEHKKDYSNQKWHVALKLLNWVSKARCSIIDLKIRFVISLSSALFTISMTLSNDVF